MQYKCEKQDQPSTARRTMVPVGIQFRTARGMWLPPQSETRSPSCASMASTGNNRARAEAAVIRHFQARMPYGLVVPDVLW